jgi:hypothetical protein
MPKLRCVYRGQTFSQVSSQALQGNIDKNSLWGGLNIQKREMCIKGILAQELGFIWGILQGGMGIRGFSGQGWRGGPFIRIARMIFMDNQ